MIVNVNQEDASTTAVRECRLHFLRAAAEHPQVRLWTSLKDEVHEPGRKLWADLGLPVPQKPSCEWTPQQSDALPAYSEGWNRLVFEWATAHELGYDWVYEAVRDALCWEAFPKSPFAMAPGYSPPNFPWTAWCIAIESEKKYRSRTKTRFLEALDTYICTVKQQQRQFLNHRFAQSSHYGWAVEHVCLGRRWSDIARKGRRVTPEAIRKAVLPILRRIGIPPRNLSSRKKNAS